MPKSTAEIRFFYEVPVTLRHRTQLKEFIQSIFLKEGRQLYSLNYIFCSDERLLEINRLYLKHDYYTDIITFELSVPGQPVEGEIYLSIDRVRDNAARLKQPLNKELLRVIFHGALHLCGYGDKTAREEKKMREQEDYYLSKYQFHGTQFH